MNQSEAVERIIARHREYAPEIIDCACGQDHETMPTDVNKFELVCRVHRCHIPCRRCDDVVRYVPAEGVHEFLDGTVHEVPMSRADQRILDTLGGLPVGVLDQFLAWAKSEQERSERLRVAAERSDAQALMICDLCDDPFLEGEAMVRIPAIGHMHQDCGFAPDEGEDG